MKNPTVANTDILDGRHANQHIPQFIGYLRIFEESDERDYHTAAKNFWDMVVPHRVYSHGGVGVGEILRKRDVIAGSLYSEPNNRNHAESCVVYNMLKLSRNLFFHDPDPKYMNYYEQGLFNQILGSRRDTDNVMSPEVTYFVPVRPGERRSYGNVGTCCGGTGMENHTKYQDSIYFRSADERTLYVNLYIPSVLEWKEKGFTIEQVTKYPFEGASTLTVRGNGRLTVMLRVPSWVRRGYTVSVNGAGDLRVRATGALDWSRPESWTGVLDRSPCGTGTCAAMAVLHAKGKLGLHRDFVHEGILGTTFTGRLIEETRVGPYAAVVPTLSGQAWITGFAQYVVDPEDPFPNGFTVGDIWGQGG